MRVNVGTRNAMLDSYNDHMGSGYIRPHPEPQREPVKFEAGQVVRVDLLGTRNGDPLMVEYVTDNHAFCVDVGTKDQYRLSIVGYVGALRVVSPAPHRGDTWSNGESVARIELCAHGDTSLRIVSEGEPFVGDVVAVARRLWEGGYRRAERDSAQPCRKPGRLFSNALDAEAAKCGLQRTPNEADEILRERIRAALGGSVRRSALASAMRWIQRDGMSADPIAQAMVEQRIRAAKRLALEQVPERALIDWPHLSKLATTASRATGDDFRDLAEVHGVPVLREGAVVREEMFDGVRFGRVVAVEQFCVRVQWSDRRSPEMYMKPDAERLLSGDAWRIVEPDVRPLASLANAVASVFARPDIATSRRFIDEAIRSLRGEPFAAAVAAVLVAAGDHPISPYQIAALVRGARAHETRRGKVAPARRTLTEDQLRSCWDAAVRASEGEWYVRLSHVYERARASC